MPTFVDLGIVTDPTTLANEALDHLSNEIEGYEPNDGNLEVIEIEAIAPMAAALSDAAGEVPLQIFCNYGTQLFNIPFEQGEFATVSLTFVATDNLGHTIPSGTYLSIGGFGFATLTEATIPVGATSIEITAAAVEVGTEYNGLTQGSGVELVDALAFIQSVTINGESQGGTEEETDLAYANRLSTQLTLMAPRPITELDYSTFALSAEIPGPTGGFISIGRAVALDGYSPENNLLTKNQADLEEGTTGWVLAGTNCTASQSATQAEHGTKSLRLSSTAGGTMATTTSTGTSGVAVTEGVMYHAQADFFPTGATLRECKVGIVWYKANGTEVSTVNSAKVKEVEAKWTRIELTEPAPATAAFAAIRVTVESTGGASELHYVDEILLSESQGSPYDGVWYEGGKAARNNQRTITLWVTNAKGEALTEAQMKAIRTYIAGTETTGEKINGKTYPGFREINFVIYVDRPDYTAINVQYEAYILAGWSETSVKEAINAALAEYLNPAKWGAPTAFESITGWENNTVVRYNKVIGVIEKVPGVDYVSALKIGSSILPTPGEANLTLVGPAPLPEAVLSEAFTGKTNSSELITGITSTAKMLKGMYVTGTGIPANTYITEVKSTELKLSASATKSEAGVALTVSNVTGTIVAEKA